MSTKIPNGFVLHETDFSRIHEMITDWREELSTLQREGVAHFLADRASFLIDSVDCGRPLSLDIDGRSAAGIAWDELTDRRKEIAKTGHRDPAVDFDFQMTLHPHQGRVYGIVFSEQREWVQAWMAKSGVERFAYWDNTDPEDGVSNKAWKARGRIWDDILDRNGGVPAMSGFSVKCTDSFIPSPQPEEIAERLPTFDERVTRMAVEKVVGERVAALQAKSDAAGGGNGAAADTSAIVRMIFDAQRWIRDDAAGQKALDDEKQRLSAVLRSEITPGDLIVSLEPQPKPRAPGL